MTFTLRPAKREGIWLLIGAAGGTGSGKTWSAMELALGLSDGKPFGVVDTENGRASHYADDFPFEVVDLSAPFTPQRYQEAIEACVNAGHQVIVVDSMSHEWEGVGGLLEQHETEMGGQQSKNLSAWIKPKMAHRKFVTYLLQVPAHIILCFRAAERVEAQRGENGRMEIVPKRTLTGLDGWVPITEKSLPFELTASFLLTADQPGVPKPIKLQSQHRTLVPLDRPLNRQVGASLRQWASGGVNDEAAEVHELIGEVLALADKLGNRDAVTAAITKNRQKAGDDLAGHLTWLRRARDKAAQEVGAQGDAADDELPFQSAQEPVEA